MQTVRPYTGRFAPSPTARQHIGNLRTALAAWLDARAAGGRILLRVEDLDPARSRPEFITGISEDYRRLGLDWDGEPCRQSERGKLHLEALQRLKSLGRVYPCFCSRKDIEQAAGAPAPGEEGPRYTGTCSRLSAAQVERRIAAGEPCAWRFRTEGLSTGFHDLLMGEWNENIHEHTGDFVVFRKDGVASYQLAVIVDDHLTGVTTVVRGADLLDSTTRQIALYQALGWEPPDHLHVPLVTGPGGRKFAKRERDLTLPDLLTRGWTIEKILGFLGCTLGILDRDEPVALQEILAEYRREKLHPAPTAIDPETFLSGPVH